MKSRRSLKYALASVCMVFSCASQAQESLRLQAGALVEFRGMCDASGAVPLSDSLFVVADDEDNILRIYDADKGGLPVDTLDLAVPLRKKFDAMTGSFNNVDLDDELDLEAATEVDGTSYWLTSHARSKSGKRKPERFQLLALSHNASMDKVEVVGSPYNDLLDVLIKHPGLSGYRLEKAAVRAAEDDFAVNIEAMTARMEGGVYIGFRNPVPRGKALVVALENPEGVVKGQPPKLGKPLELDLGGLGARGLTSWKNTYLIAAGDIAEGDAAALYAWRGGKATPGKVAVAMPENFNPEAFFTPEGRDAFLVLSDDGALDVRGKKSCKKLKNPAHKSFRGLWLKNVDEQRVGQRPSQ